MKKLPKLGTILDFYDDGKIRDSRHSKMVVSCVVEGLENTRRYEYESDNGETYTIFDMWKETIENELKMFKTIGYRIFDWNCDNFIICNPIKEDGSVDRKFEVVFAKELRSDNYYTIDDRDKDFYNGVLIIDHKFIS